MRQSRAILVEYVQEMRADLFNLTSISKKNKLYKQFLQYDSKSFLNSGMAHFRDFRYTEFRFKRDISFHNERK